MPDYRVIIPFVNESVELYEEPTFYFGDNIFIESIYVEDFGAFFSEEVGKDYKDGIKKTTKCIYIEDFERRNFSDFVQSLAIKIRYSLNCFSDGFPPIFPYAYLLEKGDHKQSSSIIEVADIEPISNIHKLKINPYKIVIERERLSDFYKLVNESCNKKPTAIFTLDRFNSCLTRINNFDKIVDLCISLESLIDGNTELVFRFCLYHSLVSEPDPSRRIEVFDLLKSLYNARSKIVHGGQEDKAVKKVISHWLEIKDLATRSINYYLAYLYEKPEGDWNEHLKKLALGTESRIF